MFLATIHNVCLQGSHAGPPVHVRGPPHPLMFGDGPPHPWIFGEEKQ